ncbi:MAG TPA: calcium-binding protein [Tepidisphaeraceae bacterium]|jgi:Ca2+-binding RTX toxin-like protein|nr:calcium-binding protein [Tepidisphaeraceae bacterium]
MNRSFEMLESRTMLSSAAVTDGTLLITGDNGVTNQISVALNADGVNLDVSTATNGGAATVQQFALSSVNRIVIKGGDQADTLSAADLNVSVKILGRNGDDIITGSAVNDLLIGGKGNDQLNGGGGNDKLMGGKGDDILVGGDGNDKLWGNQGNDNLDGGVGNDRLDGGRGTNVLTGADGDDNLFGGSGDTFDGGLGTNVLHKRGRHEPHAH